MCVTTWISQCFLLLRLVLATHRQRNRSTPKSIAATNGMGTARSEGPVSCGGILSVLRTAEPHRLRPAVRRLSASARRRSGPSNKNPGGINVDKGNWDRCLRTICLYETGFMRDTEVENYAARPSSNHPGGVIVAFVGGNTRFLREDIDYPVYCLLMTSDGANCRSQNNQIIKSHDTTATVGRNTKCWMKAACKRAYRQSR